MKSQFAEFRRHHISDLLKLALDQAFNAALITNASFENDGPHILYVNHSFCEMTGYSFDELEGKNPKLLQGEKTDPEVIERLRACLKTGEIFIGSTYNYRKDGTPYIVEWNITPLRDDDGEIIFFLSLQQDVTVVRQQAEELRLKNLEIERLYESNRRMFSIIAHEMTTPLLAASMMAKDEELIQLPETIDEIRLNIDHTLDLIDQLRDMIQPEQLIARKSLKVVDLPEMINGIISSQRVTFEYKVDMHLVLGGLPIRRYKFNTSAVRQVLLNLIRNACIHGQPNNVWVTVYSTQHSDNSSRHQITLIVSDDGRGISDDKRAGLFDEFTQSDARNQGTGIGLYVCKQVAASLKGDLKFNPRPEGGSEFVFTFEATEEDALEPKPELPNSSIFEGLKILLVEDSPTLRTLTSKQLVSAGAEVTVCEDGRAALESSNALNCDLVLTDLQMPNVNGLELSQAVRKREFSGPIFGLSAVVSEDEVAQFIASGADLVIAKPLELDFLATALTQFKQRGAKAAQS